MNEDVLKSIPPDELKKKQEQARAALSGDALKPKKSGGNKKIKRPKMLKEEERETILRSFSAEELHRKKIEAKRAMGDSIKDSEEKQKTQPKEITKLEKETLQRGHSLAQQLLTKKQTPIPPPEPEEPNIPPIKQKPVPPKRPNSLAEIAIRQQERRQALEQGKYLERRKSWQAVLLGVSIVLVLVGTGIISYYAFIKEESPPIPKPAPDKIYLITPDTETRFNVRGLTNSEVRSQFEELRKAETIDQGTVRNILFTNKDKSDADVADSDEVLLMLSNNPPDRLVRSLGQEYMVGLYAGRTNSAFLAFEITSYENSASAMFDWENGELKELANVLGFQGVSGVVKDTIWEDAYIKNTDARILKDSSEDILLIYSFLDKSTLVITPGMTVFKEVVERYNTPEKILN